MLLMNSTDVAETRLMRTAVAAVVFALVAPCASAQDEQPLASMRYATFVSQCGSTLQGACRAVVAQAVEEIESTGACPKSIPSPDVIVDAAYGWIFTHASENLGALTSIWYAVDEALVSLYHCDFVEG